MTGVPKGVDKCIEHLIEMASEDPMTPYEGHPQEIINNGLLWNNAKSKCSIGDNHSLRLKLSELSKAWRENDTSKVRSVSYRPIFKWFFWAFVVTCVALGYLGAQVPEGGYLILGRILTVYYFAFFLVVMPVVGLIEKPSRLPGSITESVLGPEEVPKSRRKLKPEGVR